MTTRRRLTWNDRAAAAPAPQPPAVPGYQEPSGHPASYAQPAADAYENGDTSSWAEDVHPGPYANSAPPAVPGADEPQGHPATDPKHYFPSNARKQARAAAMRVLERKASQCIRIAQRLLGRRASVETIEAQASDLMNLTDRGVAATLSRLSGAEDEAVANMTLTEPRRADDVMVEDDGLTADEQAMLAEMCEDEVVSEEDEMLAEMAREASRTAAALRRRSAARARRAGEVPPEFLENQKGKKDEDEDKDEDKETKEANILLARMIREEARRAASSRRRAEDETPASEETDEDKEAEDLLAEMEKEEAKKAASAKVAPKAPPARSAKAPARRAAEDEKKDEEKPSEEAPAEEKKDDAKTAASRRKADLSPEDEAMLAEMDAELGDGTDPLLDDEFAGEFGDVSLDDPMDLMDSPEGMPSDDADLIFASDRARRAGEETPAEEEAPASDDAEAKKAARLAAIRTASTRTAPKGARVVGPVVKQASAPGSDLESLWRSDPDVSGFFGS